MNLICALIYLAFSWLYKEKVKGLLQLEKVMVYAKAYYFFNLLIQNVTISIYWLCMGGLSLITSDQEDESIWKILAMENWLPDIGFKT